MDINILKQKIKSLPQKPGIYIFKNKNKTLYIGKALNLRSRVKNYLDTTDTRIRTMINRATSLTWQETSNDIEALINDAMDI